MKVNLALPKANQLNTKSNLRLIKLAIKILQRHIKSLIKNRRALRRKNTKPKEFAGNKYYNAMDNILAHLRFQKSEG